MTNASPKLRRLLAAPFTVALAHRLLRFGVFLLCWALCATLYYQFAKPNLVPVTNIDYFGICAQKVNAGSDDYPVYPLAQIRQNPSEYRLCDTPREWQPSDYPLPYMVFTQRRDGVWHLAQYNDSMADPVESFYRLDGSAVTPLFYRRGTHIAQGMGVFFGLFLGMWLSQVFWWLWRKFYKKSHE